MPEKNGTQKTQKPDLSTVTLKQPPIEFLNTQPLLQQLSEELGCPVLTFFKSSISSIWQDDLYALHEGIKKIGKVDTLALYVRSSGGSGMITLRMIHLLRSYVKKLIILAPTECASAATILALGCDEIHMGPLTALSPVDTSLTHPLSPTDENKRPVSVSNDELDRVVRLWKDAESVKQTVPETVMQNENPYKELYRYVHPLVFGAIDRASSLSIRLCEEMLSFHFDSKKEIKRIAKSLNNDYPAHGYPITTREARKLGLKVQDLSQKSQDILSSLELLYRAMTEPAFTDYNETRYHDNSIFSIVEMADVMVLHQQNYDKFYRQSDKKLITLNDETAWWRVDWKKGKKGYTTTKIFF